MGFVRLIVRQMSVNYYYVARVKLDRAIFLDYTLFLANPLGFSYEISALSRASKYSRDKAEARAGRDLFPTKHVHSTHPCAIIIDCAQTGLAREECFSHLNRK